MAMRILDTMRKQYCVYWAPTGRFDSHGKPILTNTPTDLRVRWEMVTEVFVNRQTGQEQRSRSKVWLGDDVEELGVLWLGPGDGLASTTPSTGLTNAQRANPFSLPGAWEISRFDKSPIMNPRTAADFVRTAYL